MTLRNCSLFAAAWLLLMSATAMGEVLQVKRVRASSTAPEDSGITYVPENAIDGRVSTYWAEGEDSAGLGDWIEFSFGKDVTISRIVIYSGNWDSHEFFKRHNRPKRVQVKFSNRTSQYLDIADKMERQVIALAKPVKTRMVRMVLKEVYPGSTFNVTCLAEVQFQNDLPGPFIDGIKAQATSSLPPDSAGSYGPDRLVDGIADLVWCEGRKNGSGIGERITLSWGQAVPIDAIEILNGVSYNEKTYLKNNRVSRITVQLGNNPPQEVDVGDHFGVYQTIPLHGASGSSLTLTVTDVVRGTEFDDTCLSEVRIRRASGKSEQGEPAASP